MMGGVGKAFGAVSIVNALAGGKGATVGVALQTDARVELEEARGNWRVEINGERAESRLVVEIVASVIRSCGESPKEYSGTISTSSNIPIGVGLKSSSSSSAAVALATSAALRKELSMRRIMLCSAEASLKAGVSITGAFDDVAGCLLGGLNLTDNNRRIVVRSTPLRRSFKVLIKVPESSSGRVRVDVVSVRKFSSLATAAFEMSLRGDVWTAMTMNGLLYSTILGYDPGPAMGALKAGALGAGLSGRGPAVAAVFDRRNREGVGKLLDSWQADGGRVIVTETNNRRGERSSIG
jgi:shikimate kinase